MQSVCESPVLFYVRSQIIALIGESCLQSEKGEEAASEK